MVTARPRFACPLPWCSGDVEEHGGDGGVPSDWLHQSEPIQLGEELWAQRWQTGADAERWQLYCGRYGSFGESSSAGALATILETAARALRNYVV